MLLILQSSSSALAKIEASAFWIHILFWLISKIAKRYILLR